MIIFGYFLSFTHSILDYDMNNCNNAPSCLFLNGKNTTKVSYYYYYYSSYMVLLVVVSGATSYRPFNFQNKIPQRLDEKGSPIKANRKSVFNAAK